MGRKIPGRKHRGVRDVKKQQEQRDARVQGKINAAPANPNEQEVPKSVMRLSNLRQQAEAKSSRYPLRKRNQSKSAVKAQRVIVDEQNASILKDKHSGKPTKRSHSTMRQSKKDSTTATASKRAKVAPSAPKLSKTQKRSQRLQSKKQSKMQNRIEDAAEVRRDPVAFGEVAHQPPTLKGGRHVSKMRKKNLILHKATVATKTARKSQKPVGRKTSAKGVASKTHRRGHKEDTFPVALRKFLEQYNFL